MAEFDFDELDKAVTTLMKKQTNDTPDSRLESPQTVSSDSANTVSLTASPAPQIVSASLDASEQPPAEVPSPAQARATTQSDAVVKRRGKFMDVVHPSMATARMAPKRSVSRSGQTVQPMSRSNFDEALQVTATAVQSRAVDGISQPPGVSGTALPSSGAVKPASAWPDPTGLNDHIETTDFDAQEQQPPKAEEIPAAVAPKPQDTETSTGADTSDIMYSPFLPDAKVEKRPLGVPSIEPSETVDSDQDHEAEYMSSQKSETADLDTNELSTATPDSPTDPAGSMPPELNQDILSLDAYETSQVASSDENTETEVVPAASSPIELLSEPDSQALRTPASPQPATPASVTPSLVGALPPRQAPPMPIESDETPKQSIFDSDEHQPMKHQTKRSSGWLAVLIIGAILLVGAVGGVIIYLLNNGY